VTNSYNKTQLDALISHIYFWHKTLHVSDSSSVHHQEILTLHTAMVYVIQSSVLILPTNCQQTCMTYTTVVCVRWKTPDDGQRNCPKHVEFHAKNKFEKLMHLVGFITRITGISTYETEASTVCNFPNNRLYPSCSDCKKLRTFQKQRKWPTNRDIRTPYTLIRTDQYVYTYVTNKQMPTVVMP